MGKINTARVIIGGLVAGLVINIGEFLLNVPVLGEELDASVRALNLQPPGPDTILWFVITAFLMGIVIVWLYAAVRPRFGPGPRTAVITGVVVWLLGYAGPSVGYGLMGFFPWSLLLTGIVWGFFEMILATLAGAWVYREEAV